MRDIDKKLFTAVRENKPIKVIQKLLDAGADPNAETNDGTTPLFYVETSSLAEYLIEHGANINATDAYNSTPLHYVKTVTVAKSLIDHGANIHAKNSDGATPLHCADNEKIAKYLIKHGADINAKDRWGSIPLHYAKNGDIAECLINKGSDVNAVTESVCDIYVRPCLYSQYWLKYFHTTRKATPLHLAQTATIANCLIKHGANINAKDEDGFTPLHYAKNNFVAICLLKHGANVNAKDNTFKQTPIYYACEEADLLLTKQLILHGAHINIINIDGSTPLHYATTVDIAKILIDNGANINAKDNEGKTALYYAKQHNKTELIKYLESVGAK